jgi:hypothetical protein
VTQFGTAAVILGRAELVEALGNLPGRVVQKIMDDWTMRQGKLMAALARKSAPRDRNPRRNKPETARLWRVITSSKVRSPQRKFKMISRYIAYGAKSRASFVMGARNFRPRRRKNARAPQFGPPIPRGRHFHLAVLGTTNRVQKRTGRRTGAMWGRTSNPLFWQKAQSRVLAVAGGEVGQQLRDSYDRAIEKEIKRLARKYS